AGVAGYGMMAFVVCADSLFGTLATVALFTMMMDASRPESGATDYTVQATPYWWSTTHLKWWHEQIYRWR
ncbi:MAG: hypothetical protein QGG40_21855, partial [Myxococcota bacterium]|nr:hypothetical protein [Myxococcota bacterium]